MSSCVVKVKICPCARTNRSVIRSVSSVLLLVVCVCTRLFKHKSISIAIPCAPIPSAGWLLILFAFGSTLGGDVVVRERGLCADLQVDCIRSRQVVLYSDALQKESAENKDGDHPFL